MKIFIALILCIFAFGNVGCSTCDGTKTEAYAEYADIHSDIFGCYPPGYTPERTLDAEGPMEEVPTDFLGNECGKPVYQSPCADCPK